MDLVNRYIYAVTKGLPATQREDIEKELRGLIDDMLAESAGDSQPTQKDAEAVLLELGEPSQLADRYRESKRYLIGPDKFDLYLKILKIVLAAVTFGVTVALVIRCLVDPPTNVAQILGEIISTVISAGFSAFTWVTVIFAIAERLDNPVLHSRVQQEWKPSQLPPVPSKTSVIKPHEPILGIIFGVLFLILFYFGSYLLGAYIANEGQGTTFIPIFATEVLRKSMPAIIILCCLGIAKECAKLIIGRWTLGLAFIHTVCNVAYLILFIMVFGDPHIWNQGFMDQLMEAMGRRAEANLAAMWHGFTKSFVWIVVLITILETGVALYKSLKTKLSSDI